MLTAFNKTIYCHDNKHEYPIFAIDEQNHVAIEKAPNNGFYTALYSEWLDFPDFANKMQALRFIKDNYDLIL